MNSNTARIGAVILLMISSGCLFAGPDSTPTTGHSPETQTNQEIPATAPTTPTPTEGPTPRLDEALEQPEPDQPIRLLNDWNESVAVSVEVIRNATAEVVHNDSYEVPPNSDEIVYNLREADPEGIETFTITASYDNMTARTEVETNECYAGALIGVNRIGKLGGSRTLC